MKTEHGNMTASFNYRAIWNGHRYEVSVGDLPNLLWWSIDGDEWDDAQNRAASGEEFDNASITLVGGPRSGAIVG